MEFRSVQNGANHPPLQEKIDENKNALQGTQFLACEKVSL
jgi:hypothetical protein